MAKKELAQPKMEDHKYDDFSVQSAFDTLLRAEEHRADPKMMKLIGKKLKRHQRAIRSIQDIKDAREDLLADDDDE